MAQDQGVAGWVRNREDGSVEAAFEGDPHAVSVVVSWCRIGPPRATVTAIEVIEEELEGVVGFRVTR
jgi:acylphosphatase